MQQKNSVSMNTMALILPGIGDSDRNHWQSRWQSENSSFVRVQQRDWDQPICDEWVGVLEKHIAEAGLDVVLVAHSLGCLLVAHWAARTHLMVKGALLLAPPNPKSPIFPNEATGFSTLPDNLLPFPSIVVASSDDPYGNLEFSSSCASMWGSLFINIGNAGHINSSSGFGEWREGFALFQQLAGTPLIISKE